MASTTAESIAPLAHAPTVHKSKSDNKKRPTFAELAPILDPRLLRGLSALGFAYPTPVQYALIPVALGAPSAQPQRKNTEKDASTASQGSFGLRDILARAPTGSGKTLAYGLPIMQKILDAKAAAPATESKVTRALILVPTRELSEQITSQLNTLAQACGGRSSAAFSNAPGSVSTHVGQSDPRMKSKTRHEPKATVDDAGAGEAPLEVLNIAKDISAKVLRMVLAEGQPDVIVATPARLMHFVRASKSDPNGATHGGLDLRHLESLVIDEADLMLSYGHNLLPNEAEGASSSGGFVQEVLNTPWWAAAEARGGVQRYLISATLTSDVDRLRSLLLRDPVQLDLKDSLLGGTSQDAGPDGPQLLQYKVSVSEADKFLLLYVILKLRLVRGKVLIFVNSIDRGYRLKLFLEQFGITRTAVLNHELPFTSRIKKVEAFNKGALGVMIATDQQEALQDPDEYEESDEEEKEEEDEKEQHEDEDEDEPMDEDDNDETTGSKKTSSSPVLDSKKSKKGRKTREERIADQRAAKAEYSVARGMDFLAVACVINFDLPTSLNAYTHRIGRTARAGNTGTALSFVVPRSLVGKAGFLPPRVARKIASHTAASDAKVWRTIQRAYAAAHAEQAAEQAAEQPGRDDSETEKPPARIPEWEYDPAQTEGFKYRTADALKSITPASIKEARVQELKWEMLHNDKLASYWEDNPQEFEYLQAQTADMDRNSRALAGKRHLKHVPGYLMPQIKGFESSTKPPAAPAASEPRKRTDDVPKFKTNRGGAGRSRGRGGKAGGARKTDPLKKFKR